MNTSPGWNTFTFSRGFAYAFMHCSAQPVVFNHSSRGLGHDHQQVFLYLYIQMHCLRSLCLKKLRSYLLKIVLVFSLSSCGKQCFWLSTLPDAACWSAPQSPAHRSSSFCGCAFYKRFLLVFLKSQWFSDVRLEVPDNSYHKTKYESRAI